MLLFILAAAGYYGWRWYQEKQDAEMAAVAPVRRAAPRVEPAASQPAPVVTDSATQPVGTPLTIAPSTASAAPVTTTTAPPPAATATAPPVTVTAAPAAVTATKIPARVSTPAVTPEQTSAQALPVVVPKQGSSRFQTMAREYAEHPRGKFTVQIQILCEASNLEKAISAGGTSVWFVPQTIGTRSCYRVFWGHYETREEAQRALASVPASLRDRTSAVKPVPKAQ
jgi:septal ring-binding cell division protein DamX